MSAAGFTFSGCYLPVPVGQLSVEPNHPEYSGLHVGIGPCRDYPQHVIVLRLQMGNKLLLASFLTVAETLVTIAALQEVVELASEAAPG